MLNGKELETVRNMRLFQNLTPEELSIIESSSVTRSFEKGAEIFQQGDDVLHFYGVLDGWVKLHRTTSGGEQALLGLFGKGETFAEAAMFLGHRYPASAEAVQRCKLCLFNAELFEKAAATHPSILFGMLGSVSQHLHGMMLQVEQLKTRNAKQRIGLFLLRFCGRGDGPAKVHLPYDKALIAARLGMTPESLSRNLSALKPIGVEVFGEVVAVQDCNRLAKFCTTSPLRRRSSN